MKNLNEQIVRIKKLMVINEAVPPIKSTLDFFRKYFDLLGPAEKQSAKNSFKTVWNSFDTEVLDELINVGIRSADEFIGRFARLDSKIIDKVLVNWLRNDTDYLALFMKSLKSNEIYYASIVQYTDAIVDLIQKSKIKTQAGLNVYLDRLKDEMKNSNYPESVIYSIQEILKRDNNILSSLRGLSNETGENISKSYASKIGAGFYEVSKPGLIIVAKVVSFVLAGIWALDYLIDKGFEKANELQNKNNDPNFQDDKLIERIIAGNMNSDFTSNYPDYAEALPTSYKNTIVEVIDSAKTPPTKGSTEAVLQTQLYNNTDLLRTIADGFHLKYVMDVAMSKGVKIDTNEFISQMKEQATKPFYLYKELATLNTEPEFKTLESERELLLKKYTTILKKCQGDTGYLPFDLGNNKDRFYGMVNNLVIGFITKRKVSALGTMAEKAGQAIKNQAGIDISPAASNENELKTQIESQMINSGFFPNLQQCKYNFQFELNELNESITIKNKGLVELLKKKDLLLIDEGIGGGGGTSGQEKKIITPSYDTANCPPKDELVKFQTWLDNSKKSWYKNGQLKDSGVNYGTCGQYTKDAWKTYKNEYEQWKSSGSQQTTPTITIQSISPEIAEIAKTISFYDTSGNLIKWLSPYNTKFDTDANVIKIVELAKSLKGAGDSDLISYLKAVVDVIPNIGSFDAPSEYDNELKEKINTILENKIIRPILGLAKLLFEQASPTKKRYEIITGQDSKKRLGGERTYNNRGNIDVQSVISNYLNYQTTYFAPLSLNPGNLPDFAPLIGQVANKLGKPEGGNKFTQELKDEIIKYVDNKKLSFRLEKGDIDFPLVKSLFSDRFDSAESARNKSSQPQQPTSSPTQVTEIKLPKSFETLMWYVNNVQRQIQQRTQIDFDYCKYIYNEYPKLAINAKKLMDLEKDNSITDDNSELKKIKSSIDACATSRKLQTTGSKVKDFLNVFERGINSIKNLPEPFNLNINS